MSPEETQPIVDLLKDAQGQYTALGWLGALAVVIYGALRIYQLPLIQSAGILPKWAKWINWGKWTRLGVIFGTSMLAAFLGSLAVDMPWKNALTSAIVAGFAAMGVRGAEKTARKKSTPSKKNK